MDIQVSSNFERLLFEASGRDAATVRRLMDELAQSGAFTIDDAAAGAIRAEFDSGMPAKAEAAETIASTLADDGRTARSAYGGRLCGGAKVTRQRRP